MKQFIIQEKIDYNPFQKIANAPDYLNETDKKKVNLKPIVKNKDKPNLSENRSTLNMNTINQQMVNMMKFMQQPNSNNASSGDVSPNKDSMAQTMFNPELFNQFMTTMGNSAFNNMKMTYSFLMKKLKPKKIKSRRNKRKRRVKAKVKVKIKNRKKKKKARNNQKKKEVKIKSKINKSSKNSSFYEVVLQLFKSIIMMFLFLRIAICA